MTEQDERIRMLERRWQRERNARKEAERLLEDRSRVIYAKNQELAELNSTLEAKVEQRTADLALAVERAWAAARAKGAFLANMSHELRTPLNAVLGYTDLLIAEAEDAQIEGQPNFVGDLRKVEDAAEHLLGLINDILDMSKLESGKAELCLERVELRSASPACHQYRGSTGLRK